MYSGLAAKPDWHRHTRSRLLAAIALSTFLVAAIIVLVRFADDADTVVPLEISLVAPEPPLAIDPPQPLQLIEIPEPAVHEPLPRPDIEPAAVPDEAPPVDWYAGMEDVAQSVVASRMEVPSVNPAFDARRRDAATQFRPSRAPQKKPIWENVEVDQLGRKILVHGQCHRVVDDTNVARYEIFETFYQYITFCSNYKLPPKELPWVDEVRQRYAYLESDVDSTG